MHSLLTPFATAHVPPDGTVDVQRVVEQLAASLKVDVVSLYRYDEAAEALELVATAGLSGSVIGYRLRLSQGLTGRVARERKPLSVKHPDRHPDFHLVAGSGEERLQSYLGLPLMDFAKLRGVVVIQRESAQTFLMSEIASFYAAGRELLGILAHQRN